VEKVTSVIYGVQRIHAFSLVAVTPTTISQVNPIPITAIVLWI